MAMVCSAVAKVLPFGRVDDQDAPPGGRVHVDVVHAHAGPADNLEPRPASMTSAVTRVALRTMRPSEAADDLRQLCRRQARPDIHLDVLGPAQHVQALIRNRIRHQHPHSHAAQTSCAAATPAPRRTGPAHGLERLLHRGHGGHHVQRTGVAHVADTEQAVFQVPLPAGQFHAEAVPHHGPETLHVDAVGRQHRGHGGRRPAVVGKQRQVQRFHGRPGHVPHEPVPVKRRFQAFLLQKLQRLAQRRHQGDRRRKRRLAPLGRGLVGAEVEIKAMVAPFAPVADRPRGPTRRKTVRAAPSNTFASR